MGVTHITIVDSPEKMRGQSTNHSIIFLQTKEKTPYSEQTNTRKKPKVSIKKEE